MPLWNGTTWSAPTFLTNNNALDHAPLLIRGSDGVLLLVWRRNAAGELLGSAAQPDTFLYTLWNGSTWSTPQPLLSNAAGVLGLSAARRNSSVMSVIYSQDTDGNLDTSVDQELYQLSWNGASWGRPLRLTNDGQPANRTTIRPYSTPLPALPVCSGSRVIRSMR